MRIAVMGKGSVPAEPGWVGVMVLLFLLTACTKEDFWVQKGKAEPDMQLDRFECEGQLRDKHGFYGADHRTPEYVNELRQCMSAKGYTLQGKKK